MIILMTSFRVTFNDDAFRTYIFLKCLSDDDLSDEDSNVCAICLDSYTISGPHRIVCLKCGHLFGQSCIERWIRTEKYSKCPQCKAKARLSDIRHIYARAVKAVDTTELEQLKHVNEAYKVENDNLRLENQQLKEKIVDVENCNSYKAEIEKLTIENAKLRARIALKTDGNTNELSTSTAKGATSSYFSLVAGPVVSVSTQAGSRSLDANGKFFVVTCKIRNDIFMPYGLKLITMDGREDVIVPVHSSKPRCCRFSPFDDQLVLSTGEDSTVCVASFITMRIEHRIPLPTFGWCCCWLSKDEVAVGLISGRVLKFNLRDPTIDPFDITCNRARFPIINLEFYPKQSLLFVTSLRECVLYLHQQPHVLVSDQGSINSFCYDERSGKVMLTFAPSQHHQTVTHVLYSLDLTGEQKKLKHIHTYRSDSVKLTRVVRSAVWDSSYGPIAAIYDEANSDMILYDWTRRCPAIVKRIPSAVVDIREVTACDLRNFLLGCLSETTLYLFEARC
ncbi:unnamed protein product [Thelazia callipaeda]|uniref:RING-type E3 ubiquitin transferase n=1 Tax=Thelazia callipaeda TaxID=103827 RepID=A0A0N5CJ84_THECL|nr:unnamed protein product [Thelazia callipaeda]